MPWKDEDATRHTKLASNATRRRQWRKVANSVLEETGDEGHAVRAANAAVRRSSEDHGMEVESRRRPKG